MPRMAKRHRYSVRPADEGGYGMMIEREEVAGSGDFIVLDETEPGEHTSADAAKAHAERWAKEQLEQRLEWELVQAENPATPSHWIAYSGSP